MVLIVWSLLEKLGLIMAVAGLKMILGSYLAMTHVFPTVMEMIRVFVWLMLMVMAWSTFFGVLNDDFAGAVFAEDAVVFEGLQIGGGDVAQDAFLS